MKEYKFFAPRYIHDAVTDAFANVRCFDDQARLTLKTGLRDQV